MEACGADCSVTLLFFFCWVKNVELMLCCNQGLKCKIPTDDKFTPTRFQCWEKVACNNEMKSRSITIHLQ